MRVLLIEDETRIASFVQRGLKEEGYAVDIAGDGEQGEFMAEVNPYDLVILDVMIPKQDGIAVCRQLRERKVETPILMLTARHQVKDKVLGLDAGADDYLTKPFAFEELLARVRALLRRERKEKVMVLKALDLELNQISHEVRRGGELIALTTKEYALLEYLLLHVNQVVTRTMISEHVWNENFDSLTNVIDVYIRYLRQKIDEGRSPKLIYTLRGKGYMLKDPSA